MRFLKYLIFIILIFVIGLAIYIGVQPNSFEVNRSRTIEAPAAVIYDNVIDYRNWEAWSAWVEKEPDLKISYPEQTEGVGGHYSWEGKDGPGKMKTISAETNRSIQQELQFADYEPSQIEWTFEPTEDGMTEVNWKMKSEKVPFMFKAYGLMAGGFDNMIGPDFERGLERLDSVVVNSMKEFMVGIEGIREYGGGFYLYVSSNADNTNISNKMAENFGTIMQFVRDNEVQTYGMPLTVYHEMDNNAGTVIMSNGIHVTERINVPPGSEVLCGYIPKTMALKAVLKGNYTNLQQAWGIAMQHMLENRIQPSDIEPFEIYTNDPGLVPNPANWRTEIYIPVKTVDQ